MNNKTFTVIGDSISKGIITKDNQISLAKQNAVDIVQDYYKVNINNFYQKEQKNHNLSVHKVVGYFDMVL